MAGVSLVTNDEIMELTQLVFDRYYTELKRQLRKSELPEEEVERECTQILTKVYKAIQEQGVAAMSYEMDACAIPIINEEIRKILVPLHLNGYRARRENPVPETDTNPSGTEAEEPSVSVSVLPEEDERRMQTDMVEIKEEAIQVVSNGEVQEVQVYGEHAENELNPELRTEIRRILQQEFQLEPAQIKPIVVVVNVAAPQPAAQTVMKETEETIEEKIEETDGETAVAAEPESTVQEQEAFEAVEMDKAVATGEDIEAEPVLQLEVEPVKIVQNTEAKEEDKRTTLWLWIPIVFLVFVLLWLTIGMLMSYDLIPEFDLGYEWFNRMLFELF